MMDEERRESRRKLIAWMERVNVDEVILAELARRTEAGEAWSGQEAEQRRRWEAMRATWADRTDR